MCYFLMVLKLLVLKILLDNPLAVVTAARYDYGYHPSAEEYDNILGETRRYWSHSFLKAERDKLLTKPNEKNSNTLENRAIYESRHFVPKFQYESNEAKKFSALKKPLQNIGSTLEFTYNSAEVPKPLFAATSVSHIEVKPLVQPLLFNNQENTFQTAKGNYSQESLPIYFTNPATGIVYAITELGKSHGHLSKTNGTIPIFITKEQYERDIFRLKNIYEQKCKNLRVLTTPAAAIIRLQKPLANVIATTSAKTTPALTSTPKPLKKPAPVVVKTELTVKDITTATTRPVRKRKNKIKPKPTRKIKKQKPPGHKIVPTTVRPLLANQPDGPAIILGTRTSTAKANRYHDNVPTQLEKPNFENIYSGVTQPHVADAVVKTEIKQHHLNKRSIRGQLENGNQISYSKNFEPKSQIISKTLMVNISKKVGETVKPPNNSLRKENLIKKRFRKFKLQNESSNHKSDLKAFGTFDTELIPTVNEDFKTSVITNKNVSPRTDNFNKKTKISASLEAIKSKPFRNENVIRLKQENKKHDKRPKTSRFLHKNITSIQSMTNSTKPQISWNNLKSISFLNTSNNKSSLNIKEENEKQTFPKKYFKNKPSNDMDFRYFGHHINKRSTAIIAKINSTLPNKSPHISNNQVKLKEQGFNQTQASRNASSTNSSETAKSTITKRHRHTKKVAKSLKKRKRLAKIKINHSNHSQALPRSRKRTLKHDKKIQKKPKGNDDAEYYIFDIDENYEENEDEDDDDEDEADGSEEEEEYADDEEDEEVQDEANIVAYDDESFSAHTSEAGLSVEEISDKPVPNTFNKPLEDRENHQSEVAEAVLRPPLLDYDNDKDIDLKTQASYVKKRFRRRPPQLDYDYDDDEDDSSITANLGGFFRMIFYPLQMVMGSVMDSFGAKDNSDEEDSPYTKYTSYHKTLKQQQSHSSEDYDDDEYEGNEPSSSSLSDWFSSWFSFNRRNKKIGSTTIAPLKPTPTKASTSSWLPSWLNFGATDRISSETAAHHEDYDEYDKWFASWFGEMKPKARRRTTTTSTTTQIPHVPILTIVDPMKNPQNWIGILAHHIINHTSTSTANPLKDIWNRVTTTTTTENPEIPRKIAYDKYQIWRLKPQDESQVKALEEYKKSEDGIKLQWLKGPSLRGLTDVLVPPKMLVDFQASLAFELVDHEVLIFDVGKAIAYEKTKEDFFFTTTQKPKKHPAAIASMTWHKYYEYDDIVKYLETMRMRFPHLVELIHIGRSYEGRPLIVTKIESREAAALNSAHYTAHQLNKLRHKKRIGLANAVFIEAGTHGMEWIGPATATWVINELLKIMKKNISDDQSFIRNTTWYILPVLNPDGYVYSHEFDRFWKKSRSRHISRPSGIINSAMTWLQKKRAKEKVCFGVDLDRNWHYQWGRRGSSKSACNEFYAGPASFSEPETKALSEFLMDYRTQIKLFVSMQSYGQIISYPYKANTTYDSERLDELLDVAMVGSDNLRKKGSKSRYKIDSSTDLIENRSGCSDAFAAYEVGIPFSYTLQLADNGVHGYLLPSVSIESTARDSFDIITGMLDYI